MAKKLTHIEKMVKDVIESQAKYFGMAWYEMSRNQKMSAVAAHLFFILSQNDRRASDGSTEGIPGGYIHEIHTALVKLIGEE